MKFTITTEKNTKIEMELGKEIDITLTDKKSGKTKDILNSIIEINK